MSIRVDSRFAAIVAAVYSAAAFASVTVTDNFESAATPAAAQFVAANAEEDNSSIATHAETPSASVPYPGSDFGQKYLEIDAGETRLWRTAGSTSDVYFDMDVQFTPSSSAPTPESDDKILVFVDSDGYLTVLAGASAQDRTEAEYKTTTQVVSGAWGRLTISAALSESYSFTVRLNGTLLQTEGGVSSFPSLTAASSIASVGFGGTGALDNFTVRTTDPYFSGTAVASIGEGADNEKYATLDAALADADGATVKLLADGLTSSVALGSGDSYLINLNGHSFDGLSGAAGYAVSASTSGGVTTYRAVQAVCSVGGTYYATFAEAIAVNTEANRTVLAAGSSATISIPSGSTLYLDEGAYTFSGTFDGAGTVNMASAPKKYAYNGAANGGTLFAATWEGVFQVAWDPGNVRFVIDDFGNAGSTVEIAGVSGAFSAFPAGAWGSGAKDDGTPTIATKVKLSATWTVSNGWTPDQNNARINTFALLTGTGSLIVNGTDSTGMFSYTITELSGFTGTLGGAKAQYTIGTIDSSAMPGGLVVTLGNTFAFSTSADQVASLSDTVYKYNGTEMQLPLLVAVSNDTRGIYVAGAYYTVGGVQKNFLTLDDAIADADENYYTDNGVVVTPVNAITATQYPGWTVSGSTYVHSSSVARIGETEYRTVARALEAAGSAETTIDLVGADSETVALPANVTLAVADDVAFSGTLSGSGRVVYTAAPAADPAFGTWTGTVALDYAGIANAVDIGAVINRFGVSGSTVEIGANGTMTGRNHFSTVPAPAIAVNGYVMVDNGSSANEVEIAKLTGSGVFVFGSSGTMVNYRIASLENWDGVITNMSASSSVRSIVSGSGKIVYASNPDVAPTVGSGFTGDVYLNFNYNNYTIGLYSGENSALHLGDMTGYLHDGAGGELTGIVSGTVEVVGTLTINDGWTQELVPNWTDNKVTQFRSLKVTGALNLARTSTEGWADRVCYYRANSLDASGAGTITVGNRYALRIDAVDFAAEPSGTGRLVPVVLQSGAAVDGALYGPGGTQNEPIPVTVGGVATGQQLVYVADAAAPGLYLKPSVKGFKALVR